MNSNLPSMRRTLSSRTWHGTAFVVEALVLLFFLALSMAVLMLLFGSSYERSTASDRLSNAVVLATNEAEIFASDPTRETTKTTYYQDDSSQLIEMDSDFDGAVDFYRVERLVDAVDHPYGTQYYATITVLYGDVLVYELNTSRYESKGEVAS